MSWKDVGVDDIMIIKDDNTPSSHWQLACVCAVNRSSDGRVCTVKLVLADACLIRNKESQGSEVPGVSSSEACPVDV